MLTQLFEVIFQQIDGREVKTARMSQSLVVETCCNCGLVFAMPIELYRERKRDQKNFHCPNGHPQHYVASTEQDLRNQVAREQARADQLKADRDRERRNRERAERQRSALKGQLTKVKKRVAHGVCPCCNRTFQNLQRHMESQHPEFETPPR